MPTNIEKAIIKVSKVKRKVGETRDAFLAKVVTAFSTKDVVSDEEWEGLGKPANDWVNAATKAMLAGQPLQPFPDAPAEGIAPDPAPGRPKVAAKTAAAKTAAPKAAPKAAAKTAAPKAAKAKGEGGSGRGKMTKAIHAVMIKNPNTTEAELQTKLQASGFDPSPTYIRSARAFCRQFIFVLQEQGKWPGGAIA